MNIDTMRFSHILEANDLYDLNQFLARTAFVVSHKSESIETLLGVIWYLPINSPILIISNCPLHEKEKLAQSLIERAGKNRQIYLIHQKDEEVAHFFRDRNVYSILGVDGRVINGKGEGMYIGALFASLLQQPEWIVFYDADNFIPSALLEYTLAMGKLFMEQRMKSSHYTSASSQLHNIRICWSSKPTLGGPIVPGVLGRCTRSVSPLLARLIGEWFGIQNYPIVSSNAGEQGFTMHTAQTLRFSSGYSVETFQFLDLLTHARRLGEQNLPEQTLLQQYQAQSPHFHEKGDEGHIKKMISESLGCFAHFADQLPGSVLEEVEQLYTEMELEFRLPTAYPTLNELLNSHIGINVDEYRLSDLTIFAEPEAMCG